MFDELNDCIKLVGGPRNGVHSPEGHTWGRPPTAARWWPTAHQRTCKRLVNRSASSQNARGCEGRKRWSSFSGYVDGETSRALDNAAGAKDTPGMAQIWRQGSGSERRDSAAMEWKLYLLIWTPKHVWQIHGLSSSASLRWPCKCESRTGVGLWSCQVACANFAARHSWSSSWATLSVQEIPSFCIEKTESFEHNLHSGFYLYSCWWQSSIEPHFHLGITSKFHA